MAPTKDQVCVALEKFYDHLFSILEKKVEDKIGSIMVGYDFKQNIPADFLEVFEASKKQEIELLIKLSKERAPSKLVTDCENTAAGEGFSAKAIFAQTAILEQALTRKQIAQRSHVEETEAKIAEWTQLLYVKFADMILESNSLNELKSAVDKNFNSSLVLDRSKLQEFKLEINRQIKFLEKIKFFDFYFEEESLAGKYDFIYESYQDIKQNVSMTSELKITLSGLFLDIVNKAYQPMDSKKFELMALRDGTVENVFNGVRDWVEKNYTSFKDKDLYGELVKRLKSEEETFKVWEEASHRISDTQETYRTYKPLMCNLYTMKYAGDPHQDPRALLAELPKPNELPRSPVKKHKTSISIVPLPEVPVVALTCTEEEISELNATSTGTFQRP